MIKGNQNRKRAKRRQREDQRYGDDQARHLRRGFVDAPSMNFLNIEVMALGFNAVRARLFVPNVRRRQADV